MKSPGIPRVKLLLLDDNRPFLQALRRFLSSRVDIQVVGETHSGEEVLDLIRELQPNVVLVDIVLPDVSGLSLIQQIADLYPQIGRVVLTMHETKEYRDAAFEAGAHAFVTKSDITRELVIAIETSFRLSVEDTE